MGASKSQRQGISGAAIILWPLALLTLGCSKKVAVAPPPPVVVPKAEASSPPPSLPPAPRIEVGKVPDAEPPVRVEEVIPPPPPSPSRKKKRQPVRTSRWPAAPARNSSNQPAAGKGGISAGVETVGEPQGSVPSVTTPEIGLPTPQLARMLTPEESRSYARRLDQALDRSRSALVLIQGKSLNPSQKETLSRIQAFLRQAEQTRDQDLAGAANLAERADLLARDLLARLR